jgi:hypothetical protein
MKWLEALLAFALTMIVFSTMVSVILEMIYRFLREREKLFVLMLERLFNQVLWPLVRQRLSQMNIADVRRDFVDALARNTAAADPDAVSRRRGLRRIDNSKMTVLEFAERLAGTDVGKAIAAEGQARVVAIVNDLAQKYERFCAGARTFLMERSLTYTLFISILLAFALNIDAVVLFRSFVQDEKLRQAVVARYDVIVQEMKEAEAALAKAKTEPGEDAKKNLEQIEARRKELQRQAADLIDVGLPIGYENFPGCLKPGIRTSVDIGDCNMPAEVKGFLSGMWHNATQRTPQFLFWVVSVILGGLLIGLGAPFWFDVAQGLSKSLQVLKAVGRRERETEEPAPAATAGVSPPPRNPVEAFTTAIDALPEGARNTYGR